MRTLLFLLEKEFRQLMRNKQLINILLIAPVMQLVLLPQAADFTIKNIHIAVVDNDHSSTSQKMIHKITASGYFKLSGYTDTYQKGLEMIEDEKADLLLQIPANVERNLVRENHNQVFVALDAILGTKANLGGTYLAQILRDFNNDIRLNWITPPNTATPQISVANYYWYNPFFDYHLYIVPAILVSLITSISSLQAGLNIVLEKENGTIEQINVSPIKKHIFILGKLIPFLVLGIVLFSLGMFTGWVVYGVAPVGKLYVLFIALIAYLFTMLGMGLLISTYSGTQQQAMSLAFFFINIFNILSGSFNSVDSMPHWAQVLVEFFPPSHFIKIMRMVCMKGSGLSDISYHLFILFLIGTVLNVWAVLNYRKTV